MTSWQRKFQRPFVLTLSLLLVCVIDALAAGEATRKGEQASPFDGWSPGIGKWSVKGDIYTQTDRRADCRSFAPPATWDDYIYEVRARKTGGAEGFLILFRVKDKNHFYWWNIGGWGNTRHAIETRPRRPGFPSKPGRIESNKWYDIKIALRGSSIKCYLDGELIHDVKDGAYESGGVGLGAWVTQVEYRDPVVRTLDGKRLYGASRMKLAESVLSDIGGAGDSLRGEFEALRKAGADADDARWQALYTKASGIRDRVRALRKQLSQIDLRVQRAALGKLIDCCPKEKRQAEELLKRLPDHERRLSEIKRVMAAGNDIAPPGVEGITTFVKGVSDLQRKAYTPRCPPIAFIKRKAGGRRGTNATMLSRMTGVGSAICAYDPARPDEGARTIFEDKEGFIFDMSPSYDAQKLVFAYKKEVRKREDSFHIYEIHTDGTGLRQLTTGRYHDVSPVYLPDGNIVFNSTRVESFSLCQDFLSAALHVIDSDGGNLRRLEYNTLCDTTPFVLDDGSILFTRWEYQDKNIFCTQGLWTLNPDGTQLALFYGNTLTVPNSIYGAKQIPGTRKVICTMAAHHHPPLGGIAIIDRSLGLENPNAMTTLTPDVPYRPTVGKNWRDTNWGPGDVFYPWSYADPWPISEDLFIVSYGGPMEGGPGRYRLYLLDDRGDKVLLYEDPTTSCYNAVPLVPRPLPHNYPGAPPTPRGDGRFFVLDCYQGLLDKGVKRGQVKQLRIMSQLPKKYNTEGPRYSDHYPAIGEGSYYVKYNYGTVPVYADGSAYFSAPAGVELYFQALDENGKEIRRMGTITQITAGETQGCIGCHESRNTTPHAHYAPTARLGRKPDSITPPPWGAGPVDFVKQVQPVLDKYCVECHSGRAPDGGVDLSGDKTRFFNMGFESLVFRPGLVERYHINPGPTGNFPPLKTGSYASNLTKMIEEGHGDVSVDDEGRRRIYTWIDANVPYYGTWDMSRPHTMGGRDTWHRLRGGRPVAEPWFREFTEVFNRRCVLCHGDQQGPRVGNSWINLTHPELSRALNAHLCESAGGIGITKRRKGEAPPLFKDTTDPVYQAMLAAIQSGKQSLDARPRMDMAGGRAIPQGRDFGRTF